MTDFPSLLHASTNETSTLLYTEALKRYPVRAEPPQGALNLNTCCLLPVYIDTQLSHVLLTCA